MTITSGTDVLKPIKNVPIYSAGTWNISAILMAELTNPSPAKTMIANPIINHVMSKVISVNMELIYRCFNDCTRAFDKYWLWVSFSLIGFGVEARVVRLGKTNITKLFDLS